MAATAPSDGTRPPHEPARILVVCRANIARSPFAEVLLDAHIRHRGLTDVVTVDSAGVHARTGDAAAEESRLLATQAGLDLSDHRSRHIDEVDPHAADLVLTMSTRQRDHLGLRVPGLGPRVFTVLEAARLAGLALAEAGDQDPDDDAPDGHDPREPPGAERLRAATRAVNRQRPRSSPGPDGDDVDDPYGRGERAYLEMAHTVAAALEPITELLLGPDPDRSGR